VVVSHHGGLRTFWAPLELRACSTPERQSKTLMLWASS
jgi:hypothetical protein